MNYSKGTALITGEMETTVKTLAATRGFEEYLTVVDQYCAVDVEMSTDASPDPLVGKRRLKSLLLGFLVPLHMMAESEYH